MTAKGPRKPQDGPKPVPPRLSPPKPRRSRLNEFLAAAELAAIEPMPWQRHAANIMTATTAGKWTYSDVCIVVARQNGKTTLLVPRIVMGLLAGERIMHSAQDRELPRETHSVVAGILLEHARPMVTSVRTANGQEEIRTKSGGRYRIKASRTGGARGPSNDLVIVDEAREFETFNFIAAARPTLTASENPQMIYLSNAGHDGSVVLNALRKRAGNDPGLGYVEWSTAPDRAVDDRAGWREANPALGFGPVTMQNLEDDFRAMPLAEFETEHLCRWVRTMLPRVVSELDWQRASAQPIGVPPRAFMGVAVAGDRASAVIAWQADDGTVRLTIPFDNWGRPLDFDGWAKLVHAEALRLGIAQIGYDPATDRDLVRHLWGRPIGVQEFSAASERFKRTVEGGQLRHFEADVVGSDLAFTIRKEHGTTWHAEPSNPERPVTAALAAIRAVWLATEPAPEVGLL